MSHNGKICSSCQVELRPFINGVLLVEMEIAGPNSVYEADEWHCPSCGYKGVFGVAANPTVAHSAEECLSFLTQTVWAALSSGRRAKVISFWVNPRERDESIKQLTTYGVCFREIDSDSKLLPKSVVAAVQKFCDGNRYPLESLKAELRSAVRLSLDLDAPNIEMHLAEGGGWIELLSSPWEVSVSMPPELEHKISGLASASGYKNRQKILDFVTFLG